MAWIEITSPYVTAILIAVCGILFLLLKHAKDKTQSSIPGPWRLPILGNFHQVAMCGSVVAFMEKYRKRYGNIFSVCFGGTEIVIISGYEVYKKVCVEFSDVTSYRSVQAFPEEMAERCMKNPGIVFAKQPHARAMRSFAISQLKDGGMGKSKFEDTIHAEIQTYIESFIAPNTQKPVNLSVSLSLATTNIMLSALNLHRMEYNDATLTELAIALAMEMSTNNRAAMSKNLPFLQYMPDKISGLYSQEKAFKAMDPILRSWVSDAESKLKQGAADPESFLEKFLAYGMGNGSGSQNFTASNAQETVRQLLIAGLDTTASFLQWSFLYMILYPEVQLKVQKEIDSVIGQRSVHYNDLTELPYTDAVLTEIARRVNLVASSLARTAEADMEIDGILIPAGMEILINMKSVLDDASVFEEPEKFKPERFLVGDKKLKKERVVLFGLGKRTCIGKDLAKVEYFLFFTTILQKYYLTYGGETPPSLDRLEDLVTRPKPFKLRFSER